MKTMGPLQRPELAGIDAVATDNTAGVIDAVILEIDAGSLARLGTGRTIAAFLHVETNLQEREPREKTEEGADRTDGVAVGAATAPGKDEEKDKGHSCYDECRQTAKPDVGGIKGVAIVVLSDGGEAVVTPFVKGAQQVNYDAAKTAVGSQQGDEGAEAGDERHDEKCKHGIAEPAYLGRIAVVPYLFILSRAQARKDVLHDAQRADDRTIDAAKNEGEHDEGNYDAHIQCQHSWQELYLCQPAEVGVEESTDV